MAGTLLAAAATNAWRDPYDYFGRRGSVLAARGVGHSQMLYKMIRLDNLPLRERKRVQVLEVGDSRARLLTPDLISIIDGRGVSNGGVPGMSIEASLTLVEQQAPHYPDLTHVILLTPFERICQAESTDASPETARIANYTICYLLHWDIFKMGLSAWLRPPLGTEPQEPPTPEEAVIAMWRDHFRAWDRSRADRRIKAVAVTVQRLQKRGLRVLLWLPPMREDVRKLIPAMGLEAEKERCVAELRKIAPCVDSIGALGLGNVTFTYIDPVHTDNGPAIMAELIHRADH